MISVSRIMSGGLVATGLDQIMPLDSIRDCLEFAGEGAVEEQQARGWEPHPHLLCSYRLVVRTPPSQGGEFGSNPDMSAICVSGVSDLHDGLKHRRT